MGFVIKNKSTQKQLISRTSARRHGLASKTVLVATLSAPAIVNDLVPDLTIVRKSIHQLKPAKRRIRKAGKNQLDGIIKCLKSVGQVAPVIIDGDGRVVDGHVVVDALKALNETHVNCVCLDHLTDDQLKIVQIALNKHAEGSTWELEELRPMLEELQLVGYDLTSTGFTLPELDIILQPQETEVPPETEELLKPPAAPVTEAGDLWELGKHRLLCGDALDERSYARVLGMRKADASFTDCPWNLPASTISSTHKDFKMAAGEMSDEAFQTFLDTFTALIANALEEGGVLFSCIDWRSADRVVAAGRNAGLSYVNMAVWNKGVGGMGGLYRSAHELIPIFCKGESPKTNNIELGKHGRDRTNVFSYPGGNRPGSSAGKVLKDHPTPKPVEMVEDAILDVTSRGELVLDPFMGSGTTLLAAQRSGRIAAGIEIEPAYVDVCIRRWEQMTGMQAVHAETERTFAEMAAMRIGEDLSEEGGTDNDE